MASGNSRERSRVMPYVGILGGLLGQMALQNEARNFLGDYFQLVTSDGFM